MGDFSEIFKILDRKSFLEDPSMILPYMTDFGFDETQTAMLERVLSDDRKMFTEFLRCPGSDSRKISDSIAEHCMLGSDRLFELLNEIKNMLYPETALPTKIASHEWYGKCLETDDGSALYSLDGYTLLEVKDCNTFRIPYFVTAIEDCAFCGCRSLKNAVIPDSVTSIGDNAFENCKSLESVIIPDSVKSIGWKAFSGCDRRVFSVGKNNPHYRSLDGCLLQDDELLYGRIDEDGSAIIPDSVTSIGRNAFYGCESLKRATIPDSVTSIEGNSFYGCESLENIAIPDSVTSIGSCSFSNCKSLENAVMPDSVESIGWRAFRGCKSLENVIIPDSVTDIGDEAFSGCDHRVFSVGKNNPNYRSLDGCLLYGNKLLYGRIDGGGHAIIPNSVTSIGNNAFYGCKSLKKAIIPDSVTNIGDCAFSDCVSLESVIIPDSVTNIESYVFSGCDRRVFSVGKNNPNYRSLDGCLLCGNELLYGRIDGDGYAIIPDSVTSIGNNAFYGCESLKRVTIPDSATSIGYYAFFNCKSLESAIVPDSVTDVEHCAFDKHTNVIRTGKKTNDVI